ncbi:MAG: methyltransferase [Zavarzinella sp.]
MSLSALDFPTTDPTPIFEVFRNGYATDLLTVAAIDFKLFDRLDQAKKSFEQLAAELQLAPRALNVLLTAIRAMGLVEQNDDATYSLSAGAAEHLVSGKYFEVGGYIGLVSEAPSVRAMAERLCTNKPAENRADDTGAAFIYREGLDSAMDQADSARRLTMALAGRAKNVAPYLAANVDFSQTKLLLDVAGGTGIYAIACLQKYPHLRAIVWDRPEVLKIAHEMALAYGVADRMEFQAGDMFTDPVPGGVDCMLLSNVLHDWDVPENLKLLQRCYEALPQGGKLLIHDVFLNDDLGGPLPLALYSAALFTLTEGRAYSGLEYRTWLQQVGFEPTTEIIPTLVHCGVLSATKIKM